MSEPSELDVILGDFFATYSKAIATELNWKSFNGKMMPNERQGLFVLNRRTMQSPYPYIGRMTPYRYTFDLIHEVCYDAQIYNTEEKINRVLPQELEQLHRALHTARKDSHPNTTFILVKAAIPSPELSVAKMRRQLDRESNQRHWEVSYLGQLNLDLWLRTTPRFVNTLQG